MSEFSSDCKKFLEANGLTLGISFVFIILTSAQTVSLPIWGGTLADGAGLHFSGPYVILLFTSVALVVCNGLATLICWTLFQFPPTPPFRRNFKIYFGVGFFMSINGLLLVYSSLPDRTPEMLQALLLNSGFLWSIPATKFLVKNKARYIYCAWKPLIAIGLVVWGVAISLIPLIVNVVQGTEPLFTNTGGIIWSFIFMISVAPAAVSNVIMETFFEGREKEIEKNHIYDILVINFWSSLAQLIVITCSFWMDITPVIGSSRNFSMFLENFEYTSSCLFSSKCPDSWWTGLIFIFAFLFQNLAGSFLSAESANFVNIAQTLQVPFTTLFWIAFPALNTSSYSTPIGYIVPAMLLLLVGTLLWRVWETLEKARLKSKLSWRDEDT
eukprot:TRINITY_DN10694_c0_g1_i1.p1 TRINITY_DN10694_c0_g1~~TRINITY_DN10694_c0_g1_i1.p1  ORF type:complete len:419 (+),score=67.75 TRINITY_DN10694_c0_g1_i1:107-1258(+)